MDKKDLIRKNAIKVIAIEGYHNTTIKMIADEAGIAVGTIYNYFKTKEEIIDYVFHVEHDKRIRFLKEIDSKNQSISEKIRAFLDFHFDDLNDNQHVGKVLIQESMIPTKRSMEGITRFLIDLPIIFSEMLRKAENNNEIRNMNHHVVSHAIFHAIRGVVYNLATIADTKDYVNAKEQLLDFILNGILQ